jgi:hypothetical protein
MVTLQRYYKQSIIKFTLKIQACKYLGFDKVITKEQRTLKNVNHCWKTNIYSYLETSGGKSHNLYLNVVHFFNTSVNLTYVAA